MSIKQIDNHKVLGEEKQHFGFRKTTLGLCGAILASSVMVLNAGQAKPTTVHAAELDNAKQGQTNNAADQEVAQTVAEAQVDAAKSDANKVPAAAGSQGAKPSEAAAAGQDQKAAGQNQNSGATPAGQTAVGQNKDQKAAKADQGQKAADQKAAGQGQDKSAKPADQKAAGQDQNKNSKPVDQKPAGQGQDKQDKNVKPADQKAAGQGQDKQDKNSKSAEQKDQKDQKTGAKQGSANTQAKADSGLPAKDGDISYSAVSDDQQVTINYVDPTVIDPKTKEAKIVGTQILKGKTDQDLPIIYDTPVLKDEKGKTIGYYTLPDNLPLDYRFTVDSGDVDPNSPIDPSTGQHTALMQTGYGDVAWGVHKNVQWGVNNPNWGKDISVLTINVGHAMDPLPEDKQEVKRTVYYPNAKDPTKEDKKDESVVFTRPMQKDEITGKVVPGKWNHDTQILPGVDLPPRDGYHSDNVPALTVKPGDKPQDVHAKYIPNTNKVTVHFKDVNPENVQNVPDKVLPLQTDHDEDLATDLPDGYTLAPGQDGHYKVGTAPLQQVTLKVQHKTRDITNDPSYYDQTHSTVKRTVEIDEPNAKPIVTTDSHTFVKHGVYDEVLKKAVFDKDYTEKSFTFKAVPIPTIAGYTPSGSAPAITVTPDSTDQSLKVTYKADSQHIHINYVDDQGKTVGGQDILGKTGETKDISYNIPDHWTGDIAKLPKSVTIKGKDNPVITVRINHKIDKKDNEVKNVVRTVIITTPDNKTTTKTQTATFTRPVSFDEVTQKDIAGQWDKSSVVLPSIATPDIPGYTKSSEVSSAIVTPNSSPSTLKVTYHAIGHNVTINYKDKDGNVISHQVIQGDTDKTEPISYNPPKGWTGDTSKLPQTITFKAKDNPDIDVVISHKLDPQKDDSVAVTRTVNITNPDGTNDKPVVQSVVFTRPDSIDEVTGKHVYGNWSENGKHKFAQVDVPAKVGYAPSVTVPEIEVTPDSKPETINVTYVAGGRTNSYSFVDDDANGAQVGDKIEFTAKPGTDYKLNIAVPAHYDVKEGTSVPKDYVFTDQDNKPIVIHLTHHISDVSNDSSLDLTRTVSRTIQVTNPSGKVTSETESVDFNRGAKKDDVTGKVTYGAWSDNGKKDLPAMNIPAIAGYTPSSTVPAISVTPDSKPETIKISYNANEQTGSWSFNDEDDKSSKLNTQKHEFTGKTGETVNLDIQIPAGYTTDGDIPGSYTFKGEGNKPLVINLKHALSDVSNSDPDASRTIGRTINITKPNGKTTAIQQTVTFTRPASRDMVTGKVSYGDWSNGGKQKLDEMGIPPLAGYTPSIDHVAAIEVTPDSKSNTDVDVTYIANNGQQTINYTDKDGKLIGKQEVPGKTDQVVPFVPTPPKGWVVDPSVINKLPKDLKIPAVDNPINVGIVHKIDQLKPGQSDEKLGVKDSDVNRVVTRTITLEEPKGFNNNTAVANPDNPKAVKADGKAKTPVKGESNVVVQSVHFMRAASVDEVTGQITYSDWMASGSDEFAKFDAPVIKGYIATPKSIPAQKATLDFKDPHLTITYKSANTQGHQIINYIDKDGNKVGSQDVVGKLGTDVKIDPEYPKGWTIDPNGKDNKLPSSVKMTKHNKPISISVMHKLDPIDPENPTHGLSPDDFKRTVTRPIVVTTPSGSDLDLSQHVHFTRGASYDEVTGDIIFTPWKGDQKEMPAVNLPKFDGYAPSEVMIPAAPVTIDSEFAPIHITYHVDNSQNGGFSGGYGYGSGDISNGANTNANTNSDQNANKPVDNTIKDANNNRGKHKGGHSKNLSNIYSNGYKDGYRDGYHDGYRDGEGTGHYNGNYGNGYGYYGNGNGNGYGNSYGYYGNGYGNDGVIYAGSGMDNGYGMISGESGSGYTEGMLPQTGSDKYTENAVAATGLAIVGGLSLLGLAGYKKRRKD